MSLVHISSKEQFSSLLTSSTIVVTDFYADWCGPCKAIAPMYEQLANQLSRPNQITFTKVNVDQQQDIARTYGVTAMPTFIMFKRGRPVSTIRGADPNKLSEAVRKLATEANNMEAEGGEESAGAEGASGWIGAGLPRGYKDVTDQVSVKGLDLLNRDSERGSAGVLFDQSKPSALAGKGKEKQADWVESDTDEQLMLYIPFDARIKVHSLHITSLPPTTAGEDEDEDELPMRPRTLRLYTNRSTVLGFDEAEDMEPTQIANIAAEDWDRKTGTAKVELRFVKFQAVTSLVVFFVDGDGEREKIRVDRIRVIGEAGEKRELGKLEKIGDEAGE
ncbi:putative thioredoxin [Talaromyces proteolyticus]|uniref:Thioredoxin n=1 Tax=Talaromyces proteolyticus TaxID=1131652 RepID=A0AAD4PZY0_9EURO|nr:putative thioredoxin [Talaromyces proteolyticus]KAH8700264.1 putative thioredoxin [Talaromyces proteolyticus]